MLCCGVALVVVVFAADTGASVFALQEDIPPDTLAMFHRSVIIIIIAFINGHDVKLTGNKLSPFLVASHPTDHWRRVGGTRCSRKIHHGGRSITNPVVTFQEGPSSGEAIIGQDRRGAEMSCPKLN